VNAGKCSFPDAWPGTTVCASFDRHEWFRCLDTIYDKATGHLAWTFDAATHPGLVFLKKMHRLFVELVCVLKLLTVVYANPTFGAVFDLSQLCFVYK